MLQSLQGCRAVAALLVVVYHTSHGIFRLPKYFGDKPFGPVFDFGFAGVDFFFVLSGFIIMHAHAADLGQPRLLASYLWKRFARVYPAYWVVLAAILPVYLLVPSFGKGYERDPDVVAFALFLLPHPENHPVLGVAWTLVYEIFFYVAFALLLVHRRLGTVAFFTWAGLILVYPWFGSGTYPLSFLLSEYHLRFLTGIGVALALRSAQVPLPRLVAGAGVAIFFGTGLVDAYCGPLTEMDRLLCYTSGSAMMVAGLVQAERMGLLRTPAWLAYLGNASYSIYLVHFLALSVLAKTGNAIQIGRILPAGVVFWLYVGAAVLVGCVFHHLVERPLHDWTKRFFRRPHTRDEMIDVQFHKISVPTTAVEPAETQKAA